MLKFELNMEDRKTLAKRMEALTGIHPYYTKAPLYVYHIGCYNIDREGNLLVEAENADPEVLSTLLKEGFICGGEEVGNLEAEIMEEETTRGEQEVPMDVNFDFPIGKYTGVSLRNLVNLVYSRGPLISKATGGLFRADEELVETLKDDTCTFTIANFLKTLEDYTRRHGSGLEGLKITKKMVRFQGFPTDPDMEHLTAYSQLAMLMNHQAITQKRIQAKKVNDSNEKYALRIWLLRIGMNGSEFKQTRKILMENLGGHTAFRTPEKHRKRGIC